MSKRLPASSTRRLFLKASSVGGALSAVAMSGLASFLEACTTGTTGGSGCAYGYGYGGVCNQQPTGAGLYGYGKYGYGGFPPSYGYGGFPGYGYGGFPGYGYGGFPGYGYGGYGYGGYGYGGANDVPVPSRSEEPDTALRLGLAPDRVGPAHRIRV